MSVVLRKVLTLHQSGYQLLTQYHPRTSSHGEETLDDIFNTPSRPTFTTTEDDDDLFKQTSVVEESSVQDMSADDIASYIQQNTPDSNVKPDLFQEMYK